MRRGFLCLTLIFLTSLLTFGKDKTMLYVTLTLKDSTVVKGYLRSSPAMTDRDFSVKISSEIEGKSEKYKVANIEKMEMKSEEGDSVITLWKSMFVNTAVGKYKGYISENPTMLLSIYQGKNVNGYIGHIWTLVNPLGGLWEAVLCFFYEIHGMGYADCFLAVKGFLFKKNIKKILMTEFADYPKLKEMLKDGTLSTEEFLNEPTILIRELDKIISENE